MMKTALVCLCLAVAFGVVYGDEKPQVTAFTCDDKQKVDMPRPLSACTKWCDRQYFTLTHDAYVECYDCCDASMKFSTWGNQDRPGRSCKDIKAKRTDLKTVHDNGHYYIQPQKGGAVFKVYCDMFNGGLTLIANSRGGNRQLDYDQNKHQEEFPTGGATLNKPITLDSDTYGHLAMNNFPLDKASLVFKCRHDPEDSWMSFRTGLFKDSKAGTKGVDDGECGAKAEPHVCDRIFRPGKLWGMIGQVGINTRFDNGICGRYFTSESKPRKKMDGGYRAGIALCKGLPGADGAFVAGVEYASQYRYKGKRNTIWCAGKRSDSKKAEFQVWWSG